MAKIGFIGTGVMGSSMAFHLLNAGHELYIYNRTKEKGAALVDAGAHWCDDVATVAASANVVITIIGMPEDVKDVYLSPAGLIANAAPGTVLIDMTTSSPKLAAEIAEAGAKKDIHCVDAPVTGGDIGAKNATLTIFVGGSVTAFQQVEPYLQLLGQKIVYLGPAGNGQHGKMANQISVAGATAGMTEALAYAQNAGLDLTAVAESISTGAGGSWQMANMAPRVINGDFAPGFFIKHFIKDMKIALTEATERNLDLEALATILDQYEKLAAAGHEDLGTQGLIKLYKK